jgi:predicted esterase
MHNSQTGSYSVAESAGAATLAVQRQGDLSPAVSVDYATADGTATNGLKYTAVAGTMAFGAGETNKAIVVPILNEGFVEGSKTFRVALSNPTGGAVLGSRTNAMVTITDNDMGIDFQFSSYSVAEDAGQVLIGVVRGDDGTLPVTVDFATADLSATNGLDYAGTNTTLSFAPQERLKLIPIPIINNSLKQPSRNFRVTLSNPTGGTLGSTKTTSVTIVDNDQGFQFESATYRVAEDAGAALIGVLRGTDDTNSAVTVDCATSDGSATNGLDYAGITNTLSLTPGERVKRVTVPILNNGIQQGARSLSLNLTNPTAGGVLSSLTTTTVSILDNDPGVRFELTRYTNAWGNAGVTVTVLRGNDWALGPITVDYATSDLTARAGQDYQAVSGTLQFQENETVKSLTIPLLRARPTGGTKSFLVTLSNATGGATLGTSVTTVSIVGAYFTLAPPFDTALAIRRDLSLNTLTWTGGGQLQRADRVTGPWQTLTAARSPTTVQSPIPTTFYRVTRPRPANLYVPSSYDGHTPIPLVILLHGYGETGAIEEDYLKLRPLAEGRGFLYCYPDGTIDRWGYRFWNATDAAGDFGNTGVDDAGYLRGVIEEIARCFLVDRKRIYLIGHSNGGFMSYRPACQSADLIAGIASLAGMTFLGPSRCQPSQPVNILHICGTADEFHS